MPLHTELVPATDTASRDLLVVLHGLGDSLEGYRWLAPTLGFPWLNCLLVNAPDDYFGGYSWYDFQGDAAPGIVRSRKLLTELLDGLPAQGFDHGRTALFGFSQGCLMTLETGLRYPHRLAALIGVSGYVSDLEKLVADLPPAVKGQSILVTHGLHDPLIPCGPAREQMNRLRIAGGLDLTWREFAKDHTIVPEEVMLIRQFLTAAFGR
jgi:phospholipase/carboxylesterase